MTSPATWQGQKKRKGQKMGWYAEKVFPQIEKRATAGLHKVRQRLLSNATGTVLEIGAGAGQNFDYLPETVNTYMALEPNLGLIRMSRDKLKGFQEAGKFYLFGGKAEDLPLEDNSVDTIVSFFVLCSVNDSQQVLEEVRRVLKPGGRLLFFEHVLSESPTTAKWQHRLKPIWKKVACGCDLTNDPVPLIKSVGLEVKNLCKYQSSKLMPAVAATVVEGVSEKIKPQPEEIVLPEIHFHWLKKQNEPDVQNI